MNDGTRDPVPIGKVLDGHSERLGMGGARHVGTLFASWERIVGASVAAHVTPTSLRNGTLKVSADSPTWATEIGYLRDEIKRQVNAVLHGDVVQRIEVGTGPKRGPAGELSGDSAGHRSRGGSPASEVEAKPRADDPMTALERARGAWLRRRGRRR